MLGSQAKRKPKATSTSVVSAPEDFEAGAKIQRGFTNIYYVLLIWF